MYTDAVTQLTFVRNFQAEIWRPIWVMAAIIHNGNNFNKYESGQLLAEVQ